MSERERPVAVVTGGSRGIGRAIVERFARAGVEVHFTYIHNAEAASAVVEKLRCSGCSVEASRCDARDIAASRAFVDDVVARRGRLDVLVNNAGITADALLPAMSSESWATVLETNLNGMFGTTKSAARQMMRQRAGRIVNITSVSGVKGIAGQTSYSAAKAAIIGFTRSLAHEMACWEVAVNAVAPGFVDTDMLPFHDEQQRRVAMARVPMRRFGTAEEIAILVGFLALEAPTYLTGQTVVVDGGLSV
jgi:3-oxoacyl-[acyl-carrier protein] reductase